MPSDYAGSAWPNVTLPQRNETVVLDSKNNDIHARLKGVRALIDAAEFSSSVYECDGSETKRQLVVAFPYGDQIMKHVQVPIDDTWEPSNDTDGHIVIINRAENRIYELVGARYSGVDSDPENIVYSPIRRCFAGGVFPIGGDARQLTAPTGISGVPSGLRGGSAMGAGVSYNAGLIRIAELQAGHIDHAMIFVTSIAAGPPDTNFVWPATSTDGNSTAVGAIAEGKWMQLSPEFDIRQVPVGWQRTVARCLQLHGAICVDKGGGDSGVTIDFKAQCPVTPTQVTAYNNLGMSGGFYPRLNLDLKWCRMVDVVRTFLAG